MSEAREPVPAAVWELIVRHFATAGSASQAAAHFDTYAPDALVIGGATVVPAVSIDRDRYAAGLGAGAADDPQFQPLHVLSWQADDRGGTAHLVMSETHSGTTGEAILRLSGPPWGVFGSYVATGAPPAPDAVIAHVLAELAAWNPWPQSGIGVTTGLAASWRRHRPDPTVPLLALTGARFTCQNTQRCCRSGDWCIPVTANSEKALAAVPWPALRKTAPVFAEWIPDEGTDAAEVRDFPYRLVADAQGVCEACTAEGCSVHAVLGWQPLITCQVFPYMFTSTLDGICVSRSFACPTVIANRGGLLAEQVDDVRQRLAQVQHQVQHFGGLIPVSPHGGWLMWPAYRALEQVLLDLLADETIGGIGDRLAAGHRIVAALLRQAAGAGPIDVPGLNALLAEGTPPGPVADRRPADALMTSLMAGPPAGSPNDLLAGGSQDAWFAGAGLPLGMALHEALLTRYLQEILWRKQSLKASVAVQWGLLAWIHRVWERDAFYRARRLDRPLDAAIQEDTVSAIERALVNHDLQRKMSRHPAVAGQLANPLVWHSFGVP